MPHTCVPCGTFAESHCSASFSTACVLLASCTLLAPAMSIPDAAVWFPQGVLVQRRAAEHRIVVTLPIGCAHRLGGEVRNTRTKSISYNPGAVDVLIGHHGKSGHCSKISERRAMLQAAAWSCDWYMANHDDVPANITEICETVIGTEMSLMLVGS